MYPNVTSTRNHITVSSLKLIAEAPFDTVAILQHTSLILDINVMVYWYLSKQGIHWPVPRDHMAARIGPYRGQLFFEVDHWPGTGCWLDRRLKKGQTLTHISERGLIFRALSEARRGYTAMLGEQKPRQTLLFVLRYGLENIFFFHFSLVSVQV